ncbi:replication protein A 70 kDa DNA-binding subunit C-like, partial [Silene latifolia]|uniref:replication protein A 70 kDa DNA-binding subunit C-like n=1 Tax=Silene latifolia TaxID=37657 RepID=UPI003D782AA8
MAPITVNIAAMVPSKSRYQITARVTRMWNVTLKPNESPLSLDMILLDAEGEHMHATIHKKWMHSFKEEIQEGQIYKLSHFEVAKNTRGYRPVHTNDNILKFTPFTSLIAQPERENQIQKHKFEIHPLHLLQERCNKIDYLIDVVGLLTGIENKTQVMTEYGPAEIRHIFIEDERKNNIKVSLWGEAADYLDDKTPNETEATRIIVITTARVIQYQEKYQLRSTYGTKLYVNLEIPEVQTLLERIESPKPVQHIQNNTQQEKEEKMFMNRRTITELIEMEINDPDKGKEKVYNILQNCVGKRYTFKVMIGTSNYGEERELKVVKTYILNKDLEESYLNEQQNDEDLRQPTMQGVAKQIEGNEKLNE